MRSPWFQAFLVYLFVPACSASVSSNSERPCCSACLQADRSESTVSHLLMSMLKSFRSLLQTSLQRNHWGLQLGAFPELILSERDLSGIRPSLNLAACTRTILSETFSCQVILSMRQRQRTWKMLSFLSVIREESRTQCRTTVCSKHRFCRPGSCYLPSASCWTILSWNGSDCLALLFGSESREEVS